MQEIRGVSISDILSHVTAMPQRQDSVSNQLADLVMVANRLGMFDAADAVRQLIPRLPTLEYGCHCDLFDGEEPDECILVNGEVTDHCIYAKPGMRREQCKYWRIKEAKP